ncbi:MAG: hypothetical protein ACI8UC_001659, partial [Psychromonas sp.]
NSAFMEPAIAGTADIIAQIKLLYPPYPANEQVL